MKTLMILPISILTLFTRVNKSLSTPFESIIFSPFYSKGTNSTIAVRSRSNNFKVTIYIENDRYSSLPILEATINGSGNYTFTYTNTYTRRTNKIYVVLSYKDRTITSEKADMNLASSGYIDINNNSEFSSDNYLTILNDDFKWDVKKTAYSFNNFEDYYVPDYFHKFDLSNFNIVISEREKYLFSCNPKLVMQYKNNVFDEIAGAKNGIVEFPLKFNVSDSIVTFDLAKNLYVHPTTLIVSSEKKEEYVETRHIYFPRNDMQNQDDYYCYFLFEKFGIDNDIVYHRFHIKALKNIIGDCHNSEYCVQKLYK